MLAIEPLLGAISVLGSFRIGLLGAAVQRLTPSSPFVENGGPSVAMSAGAATTVVVLWALVPLAVGAWRTTARDA